MACLQKNWSIYIRSGVENSAVVWQSSLTQLTLHYLLTLDDSLAIEQIQKVVLKMILNENYEDYYEGTHGNWVANHEPKKTNTLQEICCQMYQKGKDMSHVSSEHRKCSKYKAP